MYQIILILMHMVTLDKNKKMTQGSGKTVFGELKIHDFSPLLSLKSLKTHLKVM